MHYLHTLYFFPLIKLLVCFEGTFWHVSDIHLNISYDNGDNQWYGDYQSDASFPLVQSALKAMKTFHPNPHFIIWNGDNAYHGITNRSYFLESIKNVSEEIQLHFPNVSILPTLGNHDVNPASLFDVNSTWCKELFTIWEFFFENSSKAQIETFQKGCYYTRLIKSGNETLKIIVLNTMLWYRPNPSVKNTEDPLNQFSWLINELKEALLKKYKVFIVSHIPPGASEYSPTKYRFFHSKFNENFLEILQNYSNIIHAGFFGHQHIDAFKIVYDSQGKPRIPLFLSPSVSPFHLRGLGSINPSVRLFYWNNTLSNNTLSNCKYQQYHTIIPDILGNTKEFTLNWTLEYDSAAFLLTGISAEDLDNFSLELEKDNSMYFEKFFKYHLSGRSHDLKECSPSCRCRIVCGMRNIDYKNLDKCLNRCPIEFLTFWMTIGIVIASFLLTLTGFVIGSIILLKRKNFHDKLSYKFTIEQL